MVAPSRNHLNLGIAQVLANASPRNQIINEIKGSDESPAPFSI